MSKEAFMAAHERCIADYLEAHPDATEDEAYDRTADGAYLRMVDDMADMADNYRQRAKDGLL